LALWSALLERDTPFFLRWWGAIYSDNIMSRLLFLLSPPLPPPGKWDLLVLEFWITGLSSLGGHGWRVHWPGFCCFSPLVGRSPDLFVTFFSLVPLGFPPIILRGVDDDVEGPVVRPPCADLAFVCSTSLTSGPDDCFFCPPVNLRLVDVCAKETPRLEVDPPALG